MKSQKLRSSNKFRKKNILFISNDFNYFIDNNGSFYRMYQILSYFHKHKDFNVIVLQTNREKELEKNSFKKNIKSYYYKPIQIFRNQFVNFIDFNPFFISKVVRILKKNRIDLIHVDFAYGIFILNFLTKIPISYNAHNVESIYWKEVGKFYYKIPIFLRFMYSKFIHFIEKKAVKFAININAISFYDKKKFLDIYKIPESKISVIYRGYKENLFNNPIKKEKARERLGIDSDKFVVIFHGYYHINDANREAIHIIKEKIAPNIKDKDILFLIAGKMPPFKNQKNLKFLGFVENLKEFLYAADIAIVPIFRGSGIRVKMLDYYSANIPIIATKQGTLGLILKNDKHGYIVNPKIPIEDTIEKILYLKNNPEKLKEFKRNIINLMENEYNWDNISKRIEKRYNEIIHMKSS
ncbi:MAG: glycosyltransferase family 4 protein [Promethearchaeota archaeon]